MAMVRADTGRGRAMSAYRVMWTTVCTGLALVGAGVLLVLLCGFSVLTAVAIPLLGVVLVTCPHTVTRFRRLLGAARTPSAGQLDALAHAFAYASPVYVPVQPLTELARLTDEQLCQEWRASYLVLQERTSAAEIIETVEERQRYLDELERRDPGGLTAWLASGARAGGNPLPYLAENRSGRPAIDWDELTRGQDR